MFFWKPFWGPPFSHFFDFFQKWSIGGPPSKSDGVQNGTKIRQVVPKCWKRIIPQRLFRDPAFHETTVILVPLGPSVFQNITFSMMTGYFSVFSAFHCGMFYMSFYYTCWKKLDKSTAVEPSDFWSFLGPTRPIKHTRTPQPHNPTTQHATWFGIGPRDHATQQQTITSARRAARKRSAAPSRARRAGLQLQVPVSLCQVLEFQILKF
jgi:hypothetical protein